MIKEKEIMSKYSEPSRFDCAPQGTIIKSFNDTSYNYFIQISSYPEMPNWVTWGHLLGLILKEKATDEDFVDKCIEAFESPSREKIDNIVNSLD